MASEMVKPILTLGKPKRRRKGLAAWVSLRNFRRVVQLGFAGFILYTLIVHLVVGEAGESVTASAEAFCPLGGLESLYRYVTTGGKFVPHTHLSNLVLAGAFLGTAFLARSAFCGWICPLGFIQEMMTGLSTFIHRRVPGFRNIVKTVKTRGARLAAIDRPLRFLKYGVLVWVLSGAAIYGVMVFRDWDPWAALLTIAEFSFTPGLVVLLVTLGASFFVERPWCRYACPLGAAGGLLGRLSPVYLKREDAACTGCAVCSKACPMGLQVHNVDTVKSVDCIGCLECVQVCPRQGALDLKVGLPAVGK
ncbi:MAG: 4Fe-4S binding protein [Chloroflexota bacterium]